MITLLILIILLGLYIKYEPSIDIVNNMWLLYYNKNKHNREYIILYNERN